MNIEDARIDLHMHTTVSDGTDTPGEILARVKEAGLRIFSITDHDAVKSSRILPGLRAATDPVFIPGVEFSCKDELGKYHILGYGYDPDSLGIREAVELGHQLRMKKLKTRLDYLHQAFGFSFPPEELDRLWAMDNPGKPHLGNLMVRLGFAETKEQAIRDFIDLAPVSGPSYLRPEEAISGILASGGIPVLAHPCYGSGDQLILDQDLAQRVDRLREMGLMGLEAFYSGFSRKMQNQVLDLARDRNLYVTAGSDYHGTNKLVQLGDTGLAPGSRLAEGLIRFLQAVLPSQ